MSVECKQEYEVCLADLPLQSVLSEWLSKNFHIPCHLATWVAHLILFICTWYLIKFTIRLILSILWPILFICTSLIIFRALQHAEQEKLQEFLLDKCNLVYQAMVTLSSKIPDIFAKLFNTTSAYA